jgi:hypothetical protein
MNNTQKEISGKIGELMGEHFSNSLLVLASDQLDDEDFISVRFYGGLLTATGMAEYAKRAMSKLMDEGEVSEDPEDPEDPEDYGYFPKS